MLKVYRAFLFTLTCNLTLGYNAATSEYFKIVNSDDITCKTDKDCEYFISNSKCDTGFCKCPNEWILSSDKSECVKTPKEFGSSCTDNVQCSKILFNGGACINNQCKCKTGFHYLKGRCWKNIGLQQECIKNEQCYASHEYIGLQCKNNICGCRTNYYSRLNLGCRRIRKLGESCHLDSDCETKACERICVERKVINKKGNEFVFKNFTENEENKFITENNTELTCIKGKFAYNNECVKELGTECKENSECEHIRYATCLDGTCACEPMKAVASESNRECLVVPPVPNMAIASCREDAQCAVFGDNSFCSKKCICRTGTYFENESKLCWIVKSLGEKCSSDKDCYPSEKHTECSKSSNVCVCQKGYHEDSNKKCVKDALNVGDFCEEDSECMFPNSFCDTESSSCVCQKNCYVENKKCIRGVGTTCTEQKDCDHLKNVECKKEKSETKQCLCLENYVNSEDHKFCLPPAHYRENCTETFQCKHYLKEMGICKDGICDCSEGAHYSQGRCYENKYIGERCSSKLECLSGNDTDSVICLKGYCACHYDYILNSKQVCVKYNTGNNMKTSPLLMTPLAIFLLFRK